jgi:hypothetical protein
MNRDPEPSTATKGRVARAVTSNLLVLLYALLIALCVLYRPEEAIEFIYAGF